VCAKLIAGPEVFICDRCVMQATRLAASPAVEDQAEGSLRLEPPESQAKCSFCGLQGRQVQHLVASGLVVPAGKFGEPPRICDKCRDLGLESWPRPRRPELRPVGRRHHPGWQLGWA
jgi:hypothetical protein